MIDEILDNLSEYGEVKRFLQDEVGTAIIKIVILPLPENRAGDNDGQSLPSIAQIPCKAYPVLDRKIDVKDREVWLDVR